MAKFDNAAKSRIKPPKIGAKRASDGRRRASGARPRLPIGRDSNNHPTNCDPLPQVKGGDSGKGGPSRSSLDVDLFFGRSESDGGPVRVEWLDVASVFDAEKSRIPSKDFLVDPATLDFVPVSGELKRPRREPRSPEPEAADEASPLRNQRQDRRTSKNGDEAPRLGPVADRGAPTSSNDDLQSNRTSPRPQPSSSSSSSGEAATFVKPRMRCRKLIFKPFRRTVDGSLEHDDAKEPVDVVIPEQMAASFGLFVWPCSPVLAWYVWLHQEEFVGKRVLELGCGTALPGLLCAKIGASKVWLSDDARQPDTLRNCVHAADLNGFKPTNRAGSPTMSAAAAVDVLALTWGEYTPELMRLKDSLDFIIGSDLFFDPKVFDPLSATLSFLMGRNPGVRVLITVQERSADWDIQENLSRWRLKSRRVYPAEFLSGTGIDESELIGKGGQTIYVLCIELAS